LKLPQNNIMSYGDPSSPPERGNFGGQFVVTPPSANRLHVSVINPFVMCIQVPNYVAGRCNRCCCS